MQSIEGVEEFFLSADLAGDKLDIVDQENIHLPVFGAEFRCRSVFDGLDEFIRHDLTLGIEDPQGGIVPFDLIADGIQKVGFAEAGASIYK